MSTGIKETKEVLVAVNDLSLEFITVFRKEGMTFKGILQVLADLESHQDLKDALSAAFDNVSAVPEEIKDIDLAEGLQLAEVQLSFIPQVMTALKA